VSTLSRRIATMLGTEAADRGAYPRIDLLVMAVAVVGAVALAGADFFMRHVTKSIIEMTDIDGQKNLTTWFHSSMLLGAAISAFLILPTFSGTRQRLQWAVLGCGLAFFSLDKSISLHEQVGRGLVNTFSVSHSSGRVLWELAWSPIILATAVALILCVWEANRTTKLWAIGMLAGGGTKLVMEALMFPAIHFLGASETGIFYGLEVELEESVQLLAFACLFAGLAQFFIDRVFERAAALQPESTATASTSQASRVVHLRHAR
jgi:hypothetical protein